MSVPESGALAPVPFIVGVPRSGTTLLRLMLDAHPQVAVPPETHFIPAAQDAVHGAADPADAFVESLVDSPRWGDFGLDADELAGRVATLAPFDFGGALRAFYGLYAEHFGKPRWGDKTPNYLVHMDAIQAVLPEARFVHLIRDGRDVACSIIERTWGPDIVVEAAGWWERQILAARRRAGGLAGYAELRYEDLVSAPRAALERVCALVGLEFDPAMLEYHRGAARRMAEIDRDLVGPDGRVKVSAEERRLMHRLTRRPPQTDTSRWRTQLSPAEAQAFEAVAGDLLDQLGYAVGPAARLPGG